MKNGFRNTVEMKNFCRILCGVAAAFAFVTSGAFAAEPNDHFAFPAQKVAAGRFGVVTLPAAPGINGYTPILRFRLTCADNPAARPVLLVNNKPLAELDDRNLPRLLDHADSSAAGDGVYTYNLNKLLHPAFERRVRIGLSGPKAAFSLSEIEFFWRPEVRSMIPGPPRKERNAFQIVSGKPLQVLWHGKPLIILETVAGLGRVEELAADEKCVAGSDGKIVTHNLIHLDDPTMDFRREISLNPEGDLEVAFRGALRKTVPGNVGYSLSLPAELFDGADFTVRHGIRNASRDSKRGKIDLAKLNNGDVIFRTPENAPYTYIRYLTLTKNGRTLVLDFNPQRGDANPYCNTPAGGCSNIRKVGDRVVIGLTKPHGPERFSARLRISSGADDFYYYHGNTVSFYYSGPYCDNLGYRVSFADTSETVRRNSLLPEFQWWTDLYMMPFQAADARPEVPGVLPGWRKLAPGAKHFSGGKFFPVSSGTELPDMTESLYVLPLEPGVYMASLIVGDHRRSAGPLTITCNGETAFEGVTVARGHFRHLFFAVYIHSPEKELRLGFTGRNVSLNQLIVHNRIVEPEDFAIRRGFWAMEGLPEFGLSREVAKVAPRRNFVPRTVMGTDIAPEVAAVASKLSAQPMRLPPPHEPTSDALPDWAWNPAWGHFFPQGGNPDSGFASLTPDEVRARCREMKKNGFNAALEQGLFWYHNYDGESRREHMKRQRELNDIIHSCGLAVVRHADGGGFNTLHGVAEMCSLPGVFPVDAGALKSFQGLGCLINPKMRRRTIDLWVRYARETDCDVLMIDDIHGTFKKTRCFCAYCREAFTRDTGCILPMPDEMKEYFENPFHPLRIRYDAYMEYQEGRFMNELRAALKAVKPNICLTQYGHDHRMATGHPAGIAPYVDILGIERVKCNVLLCSYRYFHAMRKLTAGLGRFWHRPLWYWTNTDDGMKGTSGKVIWYLYRAFAALHQTGMAGSRYGCEHGDFFAGLEFRHQDPLADIAIACKIDPRYSFEKDNGNEAPLVEQVGISQILTDAHIPHVFTPAPEWRDPERLKRWKLVIVPDIDLADDDELAALRSYVASGGKLLITGRFASLDGAMMPAVPGRFAEVAGVVHRSGQAREMVECVLAGKRRKFAADRIAVELRGAKVLGTFADGSPAVTIHTFGKGVCVVSAVAPARRNCEWLNGFAAVLGAKREFRRAPESAAFLLDLLKATGYEQAPFSVETSEPRLLVEGCRDMRTGERRLQLMRMPDSGAQWGQVVKPVKIDLAAIAPARESVRIHFAESVKSAVATSPDWPGEKTLSVAADPNGGSSIALPGELLKVYTLITLR